MIDSMVCTTGVKCHYIGSYTVDTAGGEAGASGSVLDSLQLQTLAAAKIEMLIERQQWVSYVEERSSI